MVYKILITICVIFSLTSSARGKYKESHGRLPAMNVHKKFVTLSGYSSGGNFAQNFHFSHSSLIHGIAIFSHTFYRCSPGTGVGKDFDNVCTQFAYEKGTLDNPDRVHAEIKEYYEKGLIDDPSNIKGKPLYVFTGLRSSWFSPSQSLGIVKLYGRYINDPRKIMNRVLNAESVLPTNNQNIKVGCREAANGRKNFTFVANCGFNGPFEALEFMLKPNFTLQEPPARTIAHLQEKLRTFDQREFLEGLSNPQFDDVGYFYEPETCRRKRCLLHFYFHGCSSGREYLGAKHIIESGWLEIAEVNGIVVVFPQAVSSSQAMLAAGKGTKMGCWDSFGINGKLYATKKGQQVIVLKRMYDRIFKKWVENEKAYGNAEDEMGALEGPESGVLPGLNALEEEEEGEGMDDEQDTDVPQRALMPVENELPEDLVEDGEDDGGPAEESALPEGDEMPDGPEEEVEENGDPEEGENDEDGE